MCYKVSGNWDGTFSCWVTEGASYGRRWTLHADAFNEPDELRREREGEGWDVVSPD